MNDPTPAARRTARAPDESSVARELFHALSLLLGADPVIDGSPAGARWDVLAPDTGDVLGSGESVAEALEEALATARRRKPWTPRHAWRPYPRRPGWLICSRCGVRVDLDPWRPFVKPDGAGERVYYDRRGDFVWPDEYAEPPCTWLPGYRLRVLWRRLMSRVTTARRVQ